MLHNLLDLTLIEMGQMLQMLGLSPSAAPRVFKAIYRDCVITFDGVLGLSRTAKLALVQNTVMEMPQPLEEHISSDGQTCKILFKLTDGNTIEASLMLWHAVSGRRHCTICVSSQVGCSIRCPFCATGRQGFVRNLTVAEITGQILFFLRRMHAAHDMGKLTNIVFMGMGEPLLNYDNVGKVLTIINASQGLGLSAHKIMLSSAGLVPQIQRLVQDKLPLELAISLHAADDKLRDRLVPINRKYPLAELLTACSEYTSATGRRIYVEYILFAGINDSVADAEALLQLLNGLPCAVNLIAYNSTGLPDYQPSSQETALAFQRRLIAGGLRAMLRVSRGADIEAGCGQLRSR